MSAIKTVAGFAIVAAVVATGFKAQRQFNLEADSTLRPMIENSVRLNAAQFNPKINLTVPELKGFSLSGVQITRSRIGALLDSTLNGGNQSYEVYARFKEGGDDRCLTLSLEWRSKSESWDISHAGAFDRCEPAW
jgi:hypothetical protein